MQRFNQQVISIYVVPHNPVVQLHLEEDAAGDELGLALFVSPVGRDQHRVSVFLAVVSVLRLYHNLRFLTLPHMFQGLPQAVG